MSKQNPFEKFKINWNDNATSDKGKLKPHGPFREYRIKFERLPKGKKAVPSLDKLGLRSKMGGRPNWIQAPGTPKCPECNQVMTFIAQLDSFEHAESYNPNALTSVKQQYMFGDVGMIYVFMCFWCMETKSVVQCG